MYYAQLTNGIVSSVTETSAPLPEAPHLIEITGLDTALLGCTYANGVFAPPVIPTIRIISKLEYMNRFTKPELSAIYTAAKSVVDVEIWLEKFKLASEINLDDPLIQEGLQEMEIAGLLTQGRAAEIIV